MKRLSEQLAAYVPTDTKAKIVLLAKAENRTISEVITMIIEKFFKQGGTL
jgi:predicted DNA-binding protein